MDSLFFKLTNSILYLLIVIIFDSTVFQVLNTKKNVNNVNLSGISLIASNNTLVCLFLFYSFYIVSSLKKKTKKTRQFFIILNDIFLSYLGQLFSLSLNFNCNNIN